MEIALVGVSQRLAPVDVRERLAFPSIPESALESLRSAAAECVLLSTCNRTEVYAVVDGAEDEGRLGAILGDLGGLEPEAYRPYLYSLRGRDAVAHLYQVAAGLDSMIVGESQILGQVSAAHQAAAKHGATGPILNWLFPHAARAGKRVRAETGIGRAAVSVSTAAVELARRTLGSLRGRVIVVVGAGKVGELTTKALLHAGADRIMIANRTHAHAAELASRFAGGAEIAAVEGLSPEVVACADAILSSTGAVSPVLTAEMVREAMALRSDRPLLLLDLAVPRDVDPEAARIAGVTLHDIDDLQAVCDTNSAQRRREAARAEEIVAEELEVFERWWNGLRVVPTIAALRDRAEAVRRGEVERALRKLGPLSNDQRAVVEALSTSIVNKLLHEPTARLKAPDAAAAAYDAAVRELFDLSIGSTERRTGKAS